MGNSIIPQSETVRQLNAITTEKVTTAIGSMLDGNFTAANYPAGFNYAIRQQYYNADTFSTLDTLVKTDSEGVSCLGDKFSQLYQNVITDIEFKLSDEDARLLQEEQTKQGALVGQIINAYKRSEVDDSPKDYPTIQYIKGRIKDVTGKSYLNLDTRDYPELSELCRLLSDFAYKATNISKLQNQWDGADRRLDAIKENLISPTIDNGGLLVNAKDAIIGWKNIPETKQLLDSLKSNKSISISIEASNFSNEQTELHVGGQGGVCVPFLWFFNVAAHGSTSYNLSTHASSGASMSIDIEYNGITLVPAIPQELTSDLKKGWYAPDILQEASKNSGKNISGYHLSGNRFNSSSLFGKNGDLRRLKTFVISQQPKIKMRFSKFNLEQMSSIFKQEMDYSVRLFGIFNIGSRSNSYTRSNYREDSSSETLEITFEPTLVSESGSLEKQTAFILGGVVESY